MPVSCDVMFCAECRSLLLYLCAARILDQWGWLLVSISARYSSCLLPIVYLSCSHSLCRCHLVLQMVSGMGPPGGARNPVDPRFISLFNVFEIQFPSTDNLRTIYQAILTQHMQKLPAEDIRDLMGEWISVTGVHGCKPQFPVATPSQMLRCCHCCC